METKQLHLGGVAMLFLVEFYERITLTKSKLIIGEYGTRRRVSIIIMEAPVQPL
jgi:hypothetical protein